MMQIISLGELMKKYAVGQLADLVAWTQGYGQYLRGLPPMQGARIAADQFPMMREKLERFVSLLREVDLPVTGGYAGDALKCLLQLAVEPDGGRILVGQNRADMEAALGGVANTVGRELDSKLFLAINADKVAYLDPPEPMFDLSVVARFPDQIPDMFEAWNCFALGRYTAAVFHTQRLMEAGVKAMATKLGAVFGPDDNWAPVLGAIDKELLKLPSKDPGTIQLRLIHTNLNSVRIAVRNRVMHPKDSYDEQQALRALRATDAFLTELAKVI